MDLGNVNNFNKYEVFARHNCTTFVDASAACIKLMKQRFILIE